MKINRFLSLIFILILSQFNFTNLISETKENLVVEIGSRGYDVLKVTNGGDNALHLAAKKQDLESIALLLDYGFLPDRTNKAGDTALHIAAAKGNLLICTYLLEHGADVNLENALGQAPYHKALAKPYPAIVTLFETHGYTPADPFKDYLIANGLEPDKIDNAGNQLLHRLAKTKNLELMRMALQHGYQTTIQNKKGESPSTLAIKNKDLPMLQLISEYHHDDLVDLDVLSAVQSAWKEGLLFLFELNPASMAKLINQHNNKGINSFHYACAQGDLEMIQMLINYGADINKLTFSEYHYDEGERWTRDDVDFFYDAPLPISLTWIDERRSGYVHPVVSPLAIVALLHPEDTALFQFLSQIGARHVHHVSVRDQELQDYLK